MIHNIYYVLHVIFCLFHFRVNMKKERFYSDKSKVRGFKSEKVGKGYKILSNDTCALDFDDCIKTRKLELVETCELFQRLLAVEGVQFIKFLMCDRHFVLFHGLLAGSKIVMESKQKNFECSVCMSE